MNKPQKKGKLLNFPSKTVSGPLRVRLPRNEMFLSTVDNMRHRFRISLDSNGSLVIDRGLLEDEIKIDKAYLFYLHDFLDMFYGGD